MVELTLDECLRLLSASEVGRIAIVDGDFPVVLPVNHLVVEIGGKPVIALRTRSGNVIDTALAAVAFQVDGVDTARREGWSVLVRGWLRHVDSETGDPRGVAAVAEWLPDRDTLVLIEPVAITGRRLHAAELDWPFHPRAYL